MANNEPDQLAQEAAAALSAGMTYGKWKGLQHERAKNREAHSTAMILAEQLDTKRGTERS